MVMVTVIVIFNAQFNASIWAISSYLALPKLTESHKVASVLWQIEWENMERVTDFVFLDSKITGDDDCSHKIKRCLLLGRKAMRNLEVK